MKKLLLLLVIAAVGGGFYVYGQRDARLLEAAADGDSGSIGWMLKVGADVDTRDTEGRTPLILAAAAGHQRVVQQLLDAGATRDVADSSRRSPAWHAFKNGHFDLAKQLRVIREAPVVPAIDDEVVTGSELAERRNERAASSNEWMEQSDALNREKREAYEEYRRTGDRARYDRTNQDIHKREQEAYERYQDANPESFPRRKKN